MLNYKNYGWLWRVYGRSVFRYFTPRKLANALRTELAYRRRQIKLHGEFHFDPLHRRDFDKEVKGVCYEMKATEVK